MANPGDATSNIAKLALVERGADPAAIATRWQLYTKADGLYLRSPAGTVIGPLTTNAIAGGSINGTPIGATTPSTGVFTTLGANGMTLTGLAPGTNLVFDGPTGDHWIQFKDAGVTKFYFGYFSATGGFALLNAAGSGAANLRVTDAGALLVKDAVTVGGALDHDGSTLGFYGITPAARPAAYTQTYATATRTHSNPTATALTAASGAADGVVADVGAAFNQVTLNNNFKDVATAINALIVDLANVKQVLNQVVDDDQLIGVKQ